MKKKSEAIAPVDEVEAAEKPVPVHVANLDAEGTYWGVLEKHADDVVESDVLVPADCDLKHGHYRWNSAARKFDPLEREARREVKEAPSMQKAVYQFLQAEVAAGRKLPAYTAEWVEWFKTTIDARG